MNRIRPFFSKIIDDILLFMGCGCILYGLWLWNVVITWIALGIMLIVFGVLIGKAKTSNAT